MDEIIETELQAAVDEYVSESGEVEFYYPSDGLGDSFPVAIFE